MPGDFDPSVDYSGGGRYQYQGQVDPNAPSVSNGQITPEEWAAYQAKRRRDALFGILATLGGATGLGFLGQALGGAGAAAGSASVPGAVGASEAPLGGGAVTGALSATPFTSLAPYAGTVANTGTGMGGGMGAGLGSLTARDWAQLGLAGAGTIGGVLSPKPNMAPNTMTQDPNLQRLLATMQGRLDKSEPLYESIMSMANGLLPTSYQKGGGGMG